MIKTPTRLTLELWDLCPPQEIRSAKASINSSRPSAVFNRCKFWYGTLNADIGGGRFNNATEQLRDQGVTNVIFDPWNRPEAHNIEAIDQIAGGQCATATVANVLNIIKEWMVRNLVVGEAYDAIWDGGRAYFLIHEGDTSGNGRVTQWDRGLPLVWQENRKAQSYIEEIEFVFGSGRATRNGNIITAIKS